MGADVADEQELHRCDDLLRWTAEVVVGAQDPEPDETRESQEPAPAGADAPAEPLAPAVPPPPVVVPRWIQIVVLPLAIIGLWALARAARYVLLVFVIAGVIALILNPIVKLFQRVLRLPRGFAVFGVYLTFFVALAGVGVLIANPISDQVANFQSDVPGIVDDANGSLADLQDWLDDNGIGIEVQKQGSTALETLQDNVLKGSGDVVAFGRDLLSRVVRVGFALVLILVLSIYMLLYGNRIGAIVRRIMPPGDGTPEDDFPLLAQKAVYSYVRGQLLFSLIMGASAGAALWIFGSLGIFEDGKRYALFFASFFGVMELVPYVGPVLGALPPVLVALFQDPLTAVWVALLFLALQQLEGHVVAPQVFGHSLRINPILVIFALLVGAELYGIVGALIALPIAAVARETVVYLRRHLVLEPWNTPLPEVALTGAGVGVVAPRSRRCRECGAEQPHDGDFCHRCGAALPLAAPTRE
jgi:predicted PurR-regulated permease PerM